MGLVVAALEAGLEDLDHVLVRQQVASWAAHACQQHLHSLMQLRNSKGKNS